MNELPYELSIRLAFNNNSIRSSYGKLKKALDTSDDQEIYTAIGELLLWVVTTDDWHNTNGLTEYKKRKREDDQVKILFGMRHAFNCLKHNMAIFQIHQKEGGFEFPLVFPLEIKEIKVVWMSAGKVLIGEHKNQAENYIKHLQGKEVLDTFQDVVTFLNREYAKVKFG